MLPGPILVILKILAWLWVPLWAVDGATAPVLGVKDVLLLSMLALAATIAALSLYAQDRRDEQFRQNLEAHRQSEAEIALLAAMLADGEAPSPQPAPDLHLVQDPAS